MHCVLPHALLYLPLGHPTQVPWAENWPGGHRLTVHDFGPIEPVPGVDMLAVQLLQYVVWWLTACMYLPTAHSSQLRKCAVQKWPALQRSHCETLVA